MDNVRVNLDGKQKPVKVCLIPYVSNFNVVYTYKKKEEHDIVLQLCDS